MLKESSKEEVNLLGNKFLQSFARRKARSYTKDQSKLMEALYPKFRIKSDFSNLDQLVNFQDRNVVIEIGFGAGEHLLYQADSNPDKLYIGAEVFLNGVASCVQNMAEKGIKNIAFYDQDSRLLLENLPDKSIDKVFLLFADPWPKKRHNKRRIINHETLRLLHRILKDNCGIRIATDHMDYFEWILEVLAEQKLFSYEEVKQPQDHFVTRYQQKGLDEGRDSRFLELVRL